MKALFVVLSIIAGTALALVLNKLLAHKIEDKGQRTGFKVTSYFICIILCVSFVLTGFLKNALDNFIVERIKNINTVVSEIFPDSNILETNIDTNEFVSVSDKLQQTLNGVDTSKDKVLEKLAYNIFLKKLTNYINAAKNGVDTIVTMSDNNGFFTINSVLYNLKDMAIKTISPYIVAVKIGIIFLLLVYIGIYIGVVVFLKKGGVMYNKSIVFGDIEYNDSVKKHQGNE